MKILRTRTLADTDAANKCLEGFAKIIKVHDYVTDQILNVNETILWTSKKKYSKIINLILFCLIIQI